ncbi:MAG: hypothetical protein IK086_02820, partial [Clostridia bacterium]|nr:hypothetical protein [Clostridia bacterium]
MAERRDKNPAKQGSDSSLRLCLNEESCQGSPLAGCGSILDLENRPFGAVFSWRRENKANTYDIDRGLS